MELVDLATAVTLLLPLLVAADGDRWQYASVRSGKRPDGRRWLAAVLRPAPVNLAVALVLLLLPWAVAFVKVRHHHLDSGAVGLATTFSLGLPALWLALAGYWVAQREANKATGPSLTDIAEGLAGRLRSQWADEAKVRGLNDPYPLAVTWTAADPRLAGDLDALKTLATRGAGWSKEAHKNWAKGPEDLAGGGDKKLADVLAAVPTGRLVVLGEPGSGKTMLMVGLVLDLLRTSRRRKGEPIPVLAPLASWNPDRQDLHTWLGATLMTAYPDLAAAPPPGSAGNSRFEALVEAGLILPVLDGLDEVPESVRPVAITRINRELKPGEQLVITCRTGEYQAALSPRDGQGAALRAAAVQLSALQYDEVVRYLRMDAGPVAEGRWDFLGSLGTESPARQALATPLMAGLARAIYNPRPGELAGPLPNPEELCEPNMTDRTAVESRLLDAFIPAAYRDKPARREKAQKRLVFLARHLECTTGGTDLAWWQLSWTVPILKRRARWAYVYGPKGAILVGRIIGQSPSGRNALLNEGSAMSPAASLAVNFRQSILGAAVTGLWVAVLIVIGVTVLFADPAGGVENGIVFGIGTTILSFFQAAWPQYEIARAWLALRRRLPWRLMAFLADAHRRGVLRQAGAVYQFRHIELQHLLANREADKEHASSPSATPTADKEATA